MSIRNRLFPPNPLDDFYTEGSCTLSACSQRLRSRAFFPSDGILSWGEHARSSYTSDEIVLGVRFADLFQYSDGGLVSVDLKRLSDVEEAGELS